MNNYETIIIKNLLKNKEFFSKTMPILDQEYFEDNGNKQIFVMVKEHYGKFKESPNVAELSSLIKNVSGAENRQSVISSLKTIKTVEEITNTDFLIEETVKWVKEKLFLKALQIGADGLTQKSDSLVLKSQQIIEERNKISVDADLGIDFEDIDGMIDYYSQNLIGVRTQHKELNKKLGPGFLPGTLSLVLSQSGGGKSLFMSDCISGMIQKSKNVLLVSLEMADKEIMKRVHANVLEIPINTFNDLSKTEGQINALDRDPTTKDNLISKFNKIKASGTLGKLFIKDYPSGHFSPLMLEQLVESYKIEKGVEFDVIFVDYLGIMKSDLLHPSAGLYSYVKSITEELRSTAKKLSVPIISASQLNRSGYGSVTDADNSNVSDSIGSVMTADFMLFLLQNEEMKENKEINCKITKNRFTGWTGSWKMSVDYQYMKFSDVVDSETIKDVEKPLAKDQIAATDFSSIKVTATKKEEPANDDLLNAFSELDL